MSELLWHIHHVEQSINLLVCNLRFLLDLSKQVVIAVSWVCSWRWLLFSNAKALGCLLSRVATKIGDVLLVAMLKFSLVVNPRKKLIDVHIHSSLSLPLSQLGLFHYFHFALQSSNLGPLLFKQGLIDVKSGLTSLRASRHLLLDRSLWLVTRFFCLVLSWVVPDGFECGRLRIIRTVNCRHWFKL